jgi:polyphosphate kinase
MKRNLESRVEVVVPVEAPALRKELRVILDTQLDDKRSAWEMQSDGSYVQRRPGTEAEKVGSQERLIRAAEKRLKDAAKFREKGVRRRAAKVPR